MDFIKNINDLKTWADIAKYTYCDFRNSENDFIIFEKNDNKYTLLSDREAQKRQNQCYNCFILPYYCIQNIKYYTSEFAFNGFDALPRYYIIQDLFYYRHNRDISQLLWFTNAIYHIIKNDRYDWFKKCKNYNKDFIQNTLLYILDICETELEKNNIKYYYHQTKTYFSPIEPIKFNYPYINKDIDISNINVIIDYIILMIQQIKTQYRFIVIY